MKKAALIVLIIVTLVTAGCGGSFFVSDDHVFSALDSRNDEWLKLYSSEPNQLSQLYHQNALLFPERNGCITGNDAICTYWKNQQASKLKSIRVQKRVRVRDNVVYEIGDLLSDTKQIFQYLTVWYKEDSAWQRELEAVTPKTVTGNKAVPDINQARNSWMEASKDAELLVDTMYTNHAVYYKRPTLHAGKNKIKDMYKGVMQSGSTMSLESVITTQITEDLAYEIGKYSDRGATGYYIFIWQQENEKWKTRLDTDF